MLLYNSLRSTISIFDLTDYTGCLGRLEIYKQHRRKHNVIARARTRSSRRFLPPRRCECKNNVSSSRFQARRAIVLIIIPRGPNFSQFRLSYFSAPWMLIKTDDDAGLRAVQARRRWRRYDLMEYYVRLYTGLCQIFKAFIITAPIHFVLFAIAPLCRDVRYFGPLRGASRENHSSFRQENVQISAKSTRWEACVITRIIIVVIRR